MNIRIAIVFAFLLIFGERAGAQINEIIDLSEVFFTTPDIVASFIWAPALSTKINKNADTIAIRIFILYY